MPPQVLELAGYFFGIDVAAARCGKERRGDLLRFLHGRGQGIDLRLLGIQLRLQREFLLIGGFGDVAAARIQVPARWSHGPWHWRGSPWLSAPGARPPMPEAAMSCSLPSTLLHGGEDMQVDELAACAAVTGGLVSRACR